MPPASPNEDIRQSTLLRKAIRTLCTVVYLLLIGMEGAEEAVQQCRDLYAVVSSEGAELPGNWRLDPCRWATTSKLGTLHPLYFVLVARTHGLLAARTDMHSSVRDTSDAILVHLAPLSHSLHTLTVTASIQEWSSTLFREQCHKRGLALMSKEAAAIALARSLMGDREIRVVATRIRKLHRSHLTKLCCTASCIEGVLAYKAGPSLQQLQIRCIELAQQVGAVPFTRLLTDVEELPPQALSPPKWRKKDAIEYHIAGLKTTSTIPTQALDSETLPAFSRTLSSYRHKVEDVHTIVHAGIKRARTLSSPKSSSIRRPAPLSTDQEGISISLEPNGRSQRVIPMTIHPVPDDTQRLSYIMVITRSLNDHARQQSLDYQFLYSYHQKDTVVVAAAIYMTRLPWTRAERAGWSELGRLEQQEACSIEGSLFDWSPLRNGQEVRVLQIPVQIGCWRGIKLLDGMQYCMEGLLQGPRPWYCYDGLIWHPTLYLRQVGHVDVLLLLWPGPKRDDGALTATSTYYRIEDTSTMLWTLEEAWNTMNGQAWRSLRYDRSRKDPVYSIERLLPSLPYYRLATATSME